MTSLKERLEEGPVLVAEGYVFELERRGYLKAGPFVPEVVLEHPDALEQLHRDFLRAGSDVMVACTYYAHRSKLKAIGRENALEEMNRAALTIAKQVAQEEDALVAGNLSNTWEYDPKKPETEDTARAIFEEQVQWAAEADVDLVIAETFAHLGEARIALQAILAAKLPAVLTFIPSQKGTCDGYRWENACKILEDEGADVVGLNCSRGPETILPFLKTIRETVNGYVAALPVPYRTTPDAPNFQALKLQGGQQAFPVALDPFLLTRYEMADFAVQCQEMGIQYIGICCGAGPHHVRAMAEALGRTVPASKYSPDMSVHPLFGNTDSAKEHYVECLSPA